MDLASSEAREEGLRSVRLSVGGAFHSPAMAHAEPAFRAALAAVELRPPRKIVLSGLSARPFDDIRRRLLDGLTRPVRWRETLLALHELGARAVRGERTRDACSRSSCRARSRTWRQ